MGGEGDKAEPVGAGGVGIEAARIGNALQRVLDDGDRLLSGSSFVVQAASYTGMRPSVLAASVTSLFVLTLGFGFGGGIVCDVAGFLYPAWMSFKAIETPGTTDDKLWLTYWVVYAAFSIVEYFVDIILFWVPFYYLLKFAFLLYLALPCFKGAECVYNSLVRPYLLQHQEPIDKYVDQLSKAGERAAEGLTQAVQDGISLVNQAVGNATRRKNE